MGRASSPQNDRYRWVPAIQLAKHHASIGAVPGPALTAAVLRVLRPARPTCNAATHSQGMYQSAAYPGRSAGADFAARGAVDMTHLVADRV
jgi:hypothetical protein